MASKKTKYDKLTAVNKRIGINFAKLDSLGLRQLGESFADSGPGLWEKVSATDPTVKRSEIAAGLEQGLRDLSQIVASQPVNLRAAAVAAFRDAIDAEYPEFFERDKQRLENVLKRGHVRTESEYYVLQFRLDEIEGDPRAQHEVETLYKLVDDFEG
ncbi:MAG: hypothetical protein AAGC71_03795 [Pseudomonadota bacterium]